MKIVLFDQINEMHVCESLHRALAELGLDVVSTGPVWHGHRFPASGEECARIDGWLEDIIAARPETLFNFRASSLLPRHVARLRRAGIRTAVWFPDDPVLYALCYSEVVDHYDIPLHCGGRRVLDFYRQRNHRRGLNFPFWLDPLEIPYQYNARECSGDLVFFGNMHGPAKKKRYDLLCSLHDDVSIYGKVPDDPLHRCKGQFPSITEAAGTLCRYKIGLNCAQAFQDYNGSLYDFPGLAMLGDFFLPSRVLQYAAVGVPVLTLPATPDSTRHYPPGLHASNVQHARDIVLRLLPDADYRQMISTAARREVERVHSAHARARFLVAILSEIIRPLELTTHEQEFAYQYA